MSQSTSAARTLHLALSAGLFTLGATALAGPPPSFGGHYPIGVEGLKGGTLPPPGVYLRDYNLFYFADRLNDAQGDEVGDLGLFAYAQAPRVIWITDWKLLGGSYGMDVLVPFIATDFELNGTPAGRMADCSFGLGDVFVEPVTLSWHWKQADLGIGYGFWAPSGHSRLNAPAKPGKGFWSNMWTLGGTYYPDTAKTWSVSALARYEVHSQHEDVAIAPGDTLSLEYGVGKGVAKNIEIGLVGYFQQQVTGDFGSGASNDKDRVFALGPEISTFCPKLGTFFSLRYLREFAAEDHTEGNTITLTITKRL